MRKIVYAIAILLMATSFKTGTQNPITLTGSSYNGFAQLEWTVNDNSVTMTSFTIYRKENAGNLKNYYAEVATYAGDVTSAIVTLVKGSNTFIVKGRTADGGGYPSNELTVR